MNKKPRNSGSPIWNFYERIAGEKIARCKLCMNFLSFKTTITNLNHHLKAKHSTAYNELLARKATVEREQDVTFHADDEGIMQIFLDQADPTPGMRVLRACKGTRPFFVAML